LRKFVISMILPAIENSTSVPSGNHQQSKAKTAVGQAQRILDIRNSGNRPRTEDSEEHTRRWAKAALRDCIKMGNTAIWSRSIPGAAG
jgi:hypothetical protein